MDIDKIWVYRIIPIQNLEHNLRHGLFCKNKSPSNQSYLGIGSAEIISQRDRMIVKCYRNSVVNDFVPFYFSIRTPMLYNIITGHGVSLFPQKDIIYLCFKLNDLISDPFEWCFTDGNAAKAITKFFKDLANIETKIDWRSINTTDFRDHNSDGDEDRIRKKHAEFLVKGHVPADRLKKIVVLNAEKKIQVNALLALLGLKIDIFINPNNQFYF